MSAAASNERSRAGGAGRAAPSYRTRRTLLTGTGLLTDPQAERLENLFAEDRHAAVHASWASTSASSRPCAPKTQTWENG